MSDDDSDYLPHREVYAPSCAETTPSQRVIEDSMSAAAKRRVDRATSNITGKRCLIENTDESNAVEYAHCLPRATKNHMLDSLEYSWNMPRFTLNVDTRANVIRLSSKFHKLFDSSHWLLLPETSIIDVYHNERLESEFPIINQPVYHYTLLARPDMIFVPIHRQNSLPTEGSPPIDFTLYTYPYHNFPTIVSHVHPRFVLCNTGPKVRSAPKVWLKQGVWKQDLTKAADIWLSWSGKVKDRPEGHAFLNNLPNNDPDLADDDSVHTDNHRVLRSGAKRKLPEQQGSPTPAQKSSKQQRLADDGAWLDDETLREFDQQTSTHVEEKKSKKELVLEWLNGVTTTGLQGYTKSSHNASDVTMALPGAFLEHF